ncbi:MAG: hypothetical protein AB1782_18845 [Cyanobacteriota bacterium]
MVSKDYKKLLASILVVGLLSTNISVFAQQEIPAEKTKVEASADSVSEVENNVYQGEINVDIYQEDETFTGEVQQVKKGTNLELTVSTVLSSEVSMEGDEFFAEVTDDLDVDGSIVVPMGSVVHGKVTQSKAEKRLGRNGYVTIDFDYLLTPDGREIPIKARMSTKSHPLKSFAKVALTDVGYTLVGGAIGGFLALKLGGIGLAVATHGYSLAGGAAIGGAAGLTKSLVRKGKPLLISPGDQIKMKITSDIDLPVIKKSALADEELKLEGLTVGINECKIEKDPFGMPNTITMDIDIVNQSEKTFTFFDVAVVNEQGSIYYPSPFGDTDMWFQKISPGTKIGGNISFSVENPRDKHWLVFYDKYTRVQLSKISITNALRKLNAEGKSKHKKSKS